ncbi:MAG: hypothetical protein AAGH64_06010 [Planctomycetota bacterium]
MKTTIAIEPTQANTPAEGVVFIDVLTGEVTILPIHHVGVSIMRNDEARRTRFIATNADNTATVGPNDELFIKQQDRSSLKKFVELGELDPGALIVDLETFRIDPSRIGDWPTSAR